jgi:hypothetical protein
MILVSFLNMGFLLLNVPVVNVNPASLHIYIPYALPGNG